MRHGTIGGDKNDDMQRCVRWLRAHAVSQQTRTLVEQVFVWMKTVGTLCKLRPRGGERVDWTFTFAAAAYNLVRLRTLGTAPC